MKKTNTIHFESFPVTSPDSTRTAVGKMQFVYRGNYPTPYVHDQWVPLKVTGVTDNAQLGMLMGALATGKTYPFSDPEPLFSAIEPTSNNISPWFDGTVLAKEGKQVKELLDCIDQQTMCVMKDFVIGDHVHGTQVKGWRLNKMGYTKNSTTVCCGHAFGGEPEELQTIKHIQHAKDLWAQGQEGSTGTMYALFFTLPDSEKPIVKKGGNLIGSLIGDLDGQFNPPNGGFVDPMEEVMLNCTCVRLWKFPCNFNQKKSFCCQCPVYAQFIKADQIVAVAPIGSSPGEAAPPQVVMNPGMTLSQFNQVLPGAPS